MTYKSDIEIAQSVPMKHISEIAASAGIDAKYVEQYGSYKAKIDLSLLNDRKDEPDGKLILVTAITPTPAGEQDHHHHRPCRQLKEDRQKSDGSAS